jgi:hypothetical protein
MNSKFDEQGNRASILPSSARPSSLSRHNSSSAAQKEKSIKPRPAKPVKPRAKSQVLDKSSEIQKEKPI